MPRRSRGSPASGGKSWQRGGSHGAARCWGHINAGARVGGTGTPLLVAIRGEKPEVVKLLLARNANVTLADEYGDTVLASLITFGTREQVEI